MASYHILFLGEFPFFSFPPILSSRLVAESCSQKVNPAESHASGHIYANLNKEANIVRRPTKFTCYSTDIGIARSKLCNSILCYALENLLERHLVE